MPTMIDARTAAAILGISPRAVYQLAAARKLRHFRPLPGKVVFAEPDVIDYRDASCRVVESVAKCGPALASNASLTAAGSGLLDTFQKAGVRPRLTPKTSMKERPASRSRKVQPRAPADRTP